nr:carboxymuconolactone decarboxylase family protein [Actinomadura sp. CNU-125]
MSTSTTIEQNDPRSRLPDPAQYFPEIAAIAVAMSKATRNGTVPPTTIGLVQLRAGQIVGSTYHTVRQTGLLRKAGETEERITAVASWRDATYFTGAERVALELVEAVLTPNPSGERVSDELYAEASAHYDDKRSGPSPSRSARSASSSPSPSSPGRSPVSLPARTTSSSSGSPRAIHVDGPWRAWLERRGLAPPVAGLPAEAPVEEPFGYPSPTSTLRRNVDASWRCSTIQWATFARVAPPAFVRWPPTTAR